MGGPHLQSHVTFCLRGHVTNSKKLHLHFHNTYSYQTWQGGNLLSEDSTYIIRWPFDHVVTWEIQKTYICISTIPMVTKLGRAVTCGGRTSPSKSSDLLITWSRDKFKKFILHFRNTYGYQTCQSGNLRLKDPIH